MHPLTMILPVLTAALLFFKPARKMMKLIETLVHEVGHAVVGLLAGGKIYGIHIRWDTSGVTQVALPVKGSYFGRLMTSSAGYPASAHVIGALGILLAVGREKYAMFGVLFLGLITLFFARSLLTFVISLTFSGISIAVLRLYPDASTGVVLSLCILLLVCSILSMKELWFVIRLQDSSDAHALAELTFIPAKIWWWILAFMNLVGIGFMSLLTYSVVHYFSA